jgi:1-acyl-sn-glycerol-3-phosphate acyltransferase
MKIYRSNPGNKHKRNEPKLRRFIHSFAWSFSAILLSIYYFISSFFTYSPNFRAINIKLIKFSFKMTFYLNVFLLRKRIHADFKYEDVPENGHFIILNHISELEFPYDLYFIRGIMMFDINFSKKKRLAKHLMDRMALPLRPGKEIKQTVEDINDYLKITNVGFYPEGHRSFSNKPNEFKKGILKLIYEGKHKVIAFYKGGMEKLDRDIYYYKSEIINSGDFETFELFYDFVSNKINDFSKDYFEKIKK